MFLSFPLVVYRRENYHDTLVECTTLLQTCLSSKFMRDKGSVHNIMLLLKEMVDNNLVEFHREENISAHFIVGVLKRYGSYCSSILILQASRN